MLLHIIKINNLGYWNRTEYLGIGTGAASLINNQRFVEGGEIEVLSLQNQMEEYMFLGLRKIEGVSKTDFRQTFGRSIENAYGKVLIDMYQKQLLEDTGEYIRLTEKGIDVNNVAVTDGDRVEFEQRLGYHVDYYPYL